MVVSGALLAALGGCPTERECGPGTMLAGDLCVPADAGTLIDSGVDAPTDAGPCGACDTATPYCDETMSPPTCVECLTAANCTAPDLACVDGSCEQCETNDECDFADTSVCNPTSHLCEPCVDATGCGHGTLGALCATAGGSGVCIECDAGDVTHCTSGVCLTATNECALAGGSTPLCGTCTTDAECMAGQVCAPMMYDDPATGAADPVDVGAHCLWRLDAFGTGAPNGACSSIRPYVRSASVTSVDRLDVDVCTLRVSTCEAQSDFSNVNCMTLDATGDALCGATGVPDGICRMFDAGSNRCSVYCVSDDDCRAGVTCNTSATPVPVCNF